MLSNIFLYLRLIIVVSIVIINIFLYLILPEKYSLMIYKKLFGFINYLINLKITLHGNTDNLKKNKLLVMCNHYDGIDFLAISDIFDHNKLYSIVKHDLVGSPHHKSLLSDFFYYFKNVFYYSYNFIPYKRGDKDDGVVIKKIIVDKLKQNENILIFPEGRARIDGIPKDFRHGIFKLAVENQFNILPITIKYNKDAGSEMNKEVNVFRWVDLTADIYVHDIVSSENKDPLQLKDDVFKIITNILLEKTANV